MAFRRKDFVGILSKLPSLIFYENFGFNRDMTSELESLNRIRNHIINSIYLISLIFGTIALISTSVNIIKFGWQLFFLFQLLLYVIVSIIFIFRNRISLHWKAGIFFLIFFFLATSINYNNGIVSGALNFVFITTMVTLMYGWKAGVFSIVLTLIVRLIIGLGYYNGILHYQIELINYVSSLPAMVTNIMSGLVIASISVFAINKFYRWLVITLNTVSIKADELARMNQELLIAKQKAEEHDRLQSVFLANMSHEIRTPMNAIVGFTSVLAKPNLSIEKRDKYISIIHERSFDLLRIIEDILDISKIEVGQLKLVDSDINLNSFMNEIYEYYKLKMLKTEYSNKIKFTITLSDEIKTLVFRADKQRLSQIFNNLLDNAFKFTQTGAIDFGCKKSKESGLLFWVQDTGIGIPKNKQSIIFDRFRQANESLAQNSYGGTGLGLSIVQGIVKLMNGNIWVESEIDAGTTFYFSLPVKENVRKK